MAEKRFGHGRRHAQGGGYPLSVHHHSAGALPGDRRTRKRAGDELYPGQLCQFIHLRRRLHARIHALHRQPARSPGRRGVIRLHRRHPRIRRAAVRRGRNAGVYDRTCPGRKRPCLRHPGRLHAGQHTLRGDHLYHSALHLPLFYHLADLAGGDRSGYLLQPGDRIFRIPARPLRPRTALRVLRRDKLYGIPHRQRHRAGRHGGLRHPLHLQAERGKSQRLPSGTRHPQRRLPLRAFRDHLGGDPHRRVFGGERHLFQHHRAPDNGTHRARHVFQLYPGLHPATLHPALQGKGARRPAQTQGHGSCL